MFWLQQLSVHPLAGAAICLLLALVNLIVRQLVHRSRVRKRLNASFTLIAIGLCAGAAETVVGVAGFPGAVPYFNAVLVGAVAIGIVRAGLTLFVDFYLQQREGAVISAIFRDVASIVAYFLVVVVVLRSTLDINLASLIATSAVLTVIVGLALQDVLGNFFSGLVLELEQPFSRGDWVRIGGYEGVVEETGWRTTKIRTRVNELVTLPNAMTSKESVVNYSRPDPLHGDTLRFNAAYDVAPAVVRDAVLRLLAATPGVELRPEPEVRLTEYGDSSVNYSIRYWVNDFGELERIRNRVMTNLWYALRRANVRIPFPVRDLFVHTGSPSADGADDSAAIATTLRAVGLFAPLDDTALRLLAERVRRQHYGRGELVVRQGDSGGSFFVIEHGTAEVALGPDGSSQLVGRLHAGDFFGEMSLLAGEGRSATVRAATDLMVLIIDHDPFREILISNPHILEPLSEIAAQRQALQQEHRRSQQTAPATERPGAQSLREQIRAFFGL